MIPDPEDRGWRLVKFYPGGWSPHVKDSDARVQLSFNGEELGCWSIGQWSFILANTVDLTKPPKREWRNEIDKLIDEIEADFDGHNVA